MVNGNGKIKKKILNSSKKFLFLLEVDFAFVEKQLMHIWEMETAVSNKLGHSEYLSPGSAPQKEK